MMNVIERLVWCVEQTDRELVAQRKQRDEYARELESRAREVIRLEALRTECVEAIQKLAPGCTLQTGPFSDVTVCENCGLRWSGLHVCKKPKAERKGYEFL